MDSLKQDIHALFREYEDIWNSQNYAQLKRLWDEDDPEPLYLAEEQEQWRIGWPSLERYWVPVAGRRRHIEAILMRFRIEHVRRLGADFALAAGVVRHDMKLRGNRPAWGGETRLIAVLRRKAVGWRFVTYAEAHMTPLLYMQKLYEQNVSPEFLQFHAQIMASEQEK